MVNNGDQAANFIYLLGVLVLVASALMVRRIPIRQGFKMLATWILIFLAIFIVFALRSDFAALGDRDRKRVVWGKSVSVRVDIGGMRIIKKKSRTHMLDSPTN